MVAIGSPIATSIRESAAREVRGASVTVAAAAAVRRKSRRVKQPVVTSRSPFFAWWRQSRTGANVIMGRRRERYRKGKPDMLRVAHKALAVTIRRW